MNAGLLSLYTADGTVSLELPRKIEEYCLLSDRVIWRGVLFEKG